MINKEIIAFSRHKVVVSLKKDQVIDPRDLENRRNLMLISLIQEFTNLGFYLSPEVLCRLSEDDIKNLYKNLIPYIKEDVLFIGKKFTALYPGFPQQVISKDNAELWIDRDRVYSGDLEGFLRDNPWVKQEDKENIEENPEKELKLMTVEEFMEIPQQIMSSGNSLTKETYDELDWFLNEYPDLKIPERIPFKETLCFVASKRSDVELKEVNDVLRYGMYLMGSSTNLENVPKEIRRNSWSRTKEKNPEWRNLKSLPRKRRKEICQRIEKIIEAKGIDNCVKDAKSNYGHWLLLSERVHPGEFILRYPETAQFFHYLKSNNLSKQYKTFNSEVQRRYDSNEDVEDIAKFISLRPGEFVRRFDSLVRRAYKSSKEDKILDIFFDTEGMKNKTLLELLSYYDRRNDSDIPRQVKIPENDSYVTLPPLEKLPDILIETVREVIVRKILLNIKNRVTEQDLAGKTVYIDPKIKRIPIPKGMRNQNISIPVGTKYSIPNDGIIRFFVHWIQKTGKTEDLDLHVFLWKNKNDCFNVGWNTSLRTEDSVAVHSGDVLDRKGDCAEYADIDMIKLKKNGYKYIIADVMNYKGRGFDTLPCWLGYMKTDSLEAGNRTWIPRKVDLSVEINSKNSSIAAFLVDVDKSELMILDCPMDGIPVVSSGNYNKQTSIIKFFTVENKYTSYDVIKAYYEARGAEIIDFIPEDIVEKESDNQEEKIEIEKVCFEDISLDYVKILNIIGE